MIPDVKSVKFSTVRIRLATMSRDGITHEHRHCTVSRSGRDETIARDSNFISGLDSLISRCGQVPMHLFIYSRLDRSVQHYVAYDNSTLSLDKAKMRRSLRSILVHEFSLWLTCIDLNRKQMLSVQVATYNDDLPILPKSRRSQIAFGELLLRDMKLSKTWLLWCIRLYQHAKQMLEDLPHFSYYNDPQAELVLRYDNWFKAHDNYNAAVADYEFSSFKYREWMEKLDAL